MPEIYETDTTRGGGTWRGTRETPHISDAPTITPVLPTHEVHEHHSHWNKMSWGAILAGLAISLLTWLFLNLLGLTFGAASLNPLAGGGGPTAAGLTTGAGIWTAISSILSALAGGYAAGKFSGARNEAHAGWHGLTSWALTTLALTWLLSQAAGGLLGGLGGAAKTAAQVAAPGLVSLADPFSSIEESLRLGMPGSNPAELRDTAISSLRAALTGNQLQSAEASERAAQAISRAQNISIQDARTQVAHYEQEYRQTVDQAKQHAARTADDAAKAVSRAALLGALSLLLGGLAGWLGGRAAAADQSFGDRLTSSGRAR